MSPDDHTQWVFQGDCQGLQRPCPLWFFLISWGSPAAPINWGLYIACAASFSSLHLLWAPSNGNTETEKRQHICRLSGTAPLPCRGGHPPWVSLPCTPPPGSQSCQGATFPLLTPRSLFPPGSFSISAHFWVSRCLNSQLENPKRETKV